MTTPAEEQARLAETRGLVRDLTTCLEKRNAENKRLRGALEHAKGAIQALGVRVHARDLAAQRIITEELKLIVAALKEHPLADTR